MSSPRRQLSDRVLAAGARLGGTPLHAGSGGYADKLRHLLGAAVQPGQVVAVHGLAGGALIEAYAAVWAVDAVPMPAGSPDACAACHAVLGPSGCTPLQTTSGGEAPATALLQATSGSTAIARLARRSVSSIEWEAEGYRIGLSLQPTDRVAIPVPVSHSYGSGVALAAVLAGCDLHASASRLPTSVAAHLDSGQVNKLAVTPALAGLLSNTARRGPCAADTVLVGAGVLEPALAASLGRRFGACVLVGYGSTETGGTFIGSRGIGRPAVGVEVVEPAIGTQGPLVLRLPTPVLGYAHETPRDSCLWHTGDIVAREADGTVLHMRRESDDRVRVNGVFVDVTPLSTAARSLAGVREHSVVVVPDDRGVGAETLCLVVASPTLNARRVAAELAWQGPSLRVVTCESLPRNEIGKLDRAALLNLARRA